MAIEIRITADTAQAALDEMARFVGNHIKIEWKEIDGADMSPPAQQPQSESEPKGRRGRPRKSETTKPDESFVEPAEASAPEQCGPAQDSPAPAPEPTPSAAEPVEDIKALQNECRVMSAELLSKKVLDAGQITALIRECGADKIGELPVDGIKKLKFRLERELGK